MTDCVCKPITAPGRPVCLPANRRPRASTARQGVGFMIPSDTAPTACSMAGTILASAPASSARWSIGCSDIPTRALTIGNEAVAMAERLAHPFSLEIALLYNAMLHLDRGEPELALRRLDAAETLVAEQRLGFVCGTAVPARSRPDCAGRVRGGRRVLARGARQPARRVDGSPLRPCPLVRSPDAAGRARGGSRRGERGLEVQERNGQPPVGARNFSASQASRSWVSTGSKTPNAPSKRRCASREGNRPRRTSCAPRRASPGSGANRGGEPKRVKYSRPCTAGSPRGSTPPI